MQLIVILQLTTVLIAGIPNEKQGLSLAIHVVSNDPADGNVICFVSIEEKQAAVVTAFPCPEYLMLVNWANILNLP